MPVLPEFLWQLMEAAVLLQHFDLVAVRVLHEEETRQKRALALEGDNVARRKTGRPETGVLGIEIIDDNRQMPITIAQIIGLGLILVDG